MAVTVTVPWKSCVVSEALKEREWYETGKGCCYNPIKEEKSFQSVLSSEVLVKRYG